MGESSSKKRRVSVRLGLSDTAVFELQTWARKSFSHRTLKGQIVHWIKVELFMARIFNARQLQRVDSTYVRGGMKYKIILDQETSQQVRSLASRMKTSVPDVIFRMVADALERKKRLSSDDN
jgi:hypothetical protein